MNLEKAIEKLKAEQSFINRDLEPENWQAHQLGIEAIKFRQRWEEQEGENDFPRLPSETDE